MRLANVTAMRFQNMDVVFPGPFRQSSASSRWGEGEGEGEEEAGRGRRDGDGAGEGSGREGGGREGAGRGRGRMRTSATCRICSSSTQGAAIGSDPVYSSYDSCLPLRGAHPIKDGIRSNSVSSSITIGKSPTQGGSQQTTRHNTDSVLQATSLQSIASVVSLCLGKALAASGTTPSHPYLTLGPPSARAPSPPLQRARRVGRLSLRRRVHVPLPGPLASSPPRLLLPPLRDEGDCEAGSWIRPSSPT